MSSQDELRTDFFVRPITEGRIEYGIAQEALRSAPGKLAAMMAAQLLLGARQAHQQSGRPAPSDQDTLMAIVEPSTCAAYVHPTKPRHITLQAGFDGPTLGLALTPEAAKTLANQLLAMTADGNRQ